MLQPANRLTLIDAMRPPAGYVFDEAIAVTFTLDLRALLAAPAAFALSQSVEVEGSDAQTEPIELLHAVRANAGSITVFSQAGEIALPPSRRVFAFLEGSVVPVTAPRGGVVHPKLWVLRYLDPDGEQPAHLRVLSGSRNLTFDTSWDTVLRLDTVHPINHDTGIALDPIADLFDVLAGRSVGRLAEKHRLRVASLNADLHGRRFALPDGVEGLAVHVLGLRSAPSPLPKLADRSLVVSPFVSDDFLARIHSHRVDELVTRAEQLDALGPAALRRIGATYVFDDGSTPEFDTNTDGLAVHDPARPLRGLHAKVFVYETGRLAQLFCGSANATGAAFTANVEVLFELSGRINILGIDALCDGTGDEVGLRALFLPYRRAEEAVPEADDHLDATRRAIGRLEITGQVEESVTGWSVTYGSKKPIPDGVDLSIACWPLPSPGYRRPVQPGTPLEVTFQTSVEGISGFLVIEVTNGSGVSTHCVVPTKLEGVPEDRDRQLLRALVGSADRFLRYLLALLTDGADDLGLIEALELASDDRKTVEHQGAAGLPVLEHLVRTLRTDPARLNAIDPLVSDLAVDDALPPGFEDLWRQLHVVASQLRTP